MADTQTDPTTPAAADPLADSLAAVHRHLERPSLADAEPGLLAVDMDDTSITRSGGTHDAEDSDADAEAGEEAQEVATASEVTEPSQPPPRHAGRHHPWRLGRSRSCRHPPHDRLPPVAAGPACCEQEDRTRSPHALAIPPAGRSTPRSMWPPRRTS
jgi:hypothetical protein